MKPHGAFSDFDKFLPRATPDLGNLEPRFKTPKNASNFSPHQRQRYEMEQEQVRARKTVRRIQHVGRHAIV